VDLVAIEEPLEIRLVYGPTHARTTQGIYVTMRTPGDDAELAGGFLSAEHILSHPDEILDLQSCGSELGAGGSHNIIRVELHPNVEVNLNPLERLFLATSSCGICGKTSLDALQATCRFDYRADWPVIPAELVHAIPRRLRESQATFDQTGGLHAAGLFDTDGRLLRLREDVGRHNAVDKVIGAEFLAGKLPLSERIICVSGRASFELMQKTLRAGIPIMIAVGAPSSLAVELAQRFGITLLGFVRDDRFNVYAGADRIHF
jgi:FdhD protein